LAELHWSGDCSRLGFIESNETNHAFVVLSGNSVEARVPIPASVGGTASVLPLGSSFLIVSDPDVQNDTSALLYNTTTHTLDPAPTVLQQLQQREAAEQKVMTTLGGQSPDWYRSQ
jgi:hypothetical protein